MAETVGIEPAAGPTPTAVDVVTRTATPAGDDLPDGDASTPDSRGADVDAPAQGASVPLRRGLPRASGAEPWPPAGSAASVPASVSDVIAPAADAPGITSMPPAAYASANAAPPQAPVSPGDLPARVDAEVPLAERAPLTVPRSVWPGRAANRRPVPVAEPVRLGPFTKLQWAGALVVGGLALLILAGMAVALVRFLLSLDALRDFVATYPGEYHLPEGAPVGIPAWLGWQHFFNAFLMVLIIRTGLTVRREKRPAVFWTPRRNKKGKTSLTIWFHQALDLLWIVNGAVFVVLLFVTGQWMRIVPTSWEVFPNAVSAVLQYISLDWPTENGWVNYNSLQQLAYFSTVFIAAPLAIASGFRMSGLWPKKNAKLSAAYPIEWARKIHFPTMLFFVVFIAIHVFLVLATGALRNLNHMYAAQGSTDPTAYADNWTGFWFFVLSLAVIAGAWVAARPMVIAPVARLFGTVSSR
ncbi:MULTISPECIES: cytochrome b/b6 domain-containing protein [unclassified Microbacterium]|uniref:cytochrome b/b6 domain-containing protein n=1 Tax=unclassified Microbacterium TaxID=2609290 RepID=UPI0030182792